MGDNNINKNIIGKEMKKTEIKQDENDKVKIEMETKESKEVNTILKPLNIAISEETLSIEKAQEEKSSPKITINRKRDDICLAPTNNAEGNVCMKPLPEERVPKLVMANINSTVPSTPPPVKRRPVRNAFFIEEETVCDEVFSTKGHRTTRVPRCRDSVTVFPPGCMGVKAEEPIATSPRRFLNQNECWVRDSGHIESTPTKKRSTTGRPKVRNPLTGEGYDDDEDTRSPTTNARKQDGNPVLGKGYDSENSAAKPGRVPPGGYCHKLW